MRTNRWNDTYYDICLVQSLKIFLFLSASYNNHRPVMSGKDIVYHESGYSPITILERVNPYITVMKKSC